MTPCRLVPAAGSWGPGGLYKGLHLFCKEKAPAGDPQSLWCKCMGGPLRRSLRGVSAPRTETQLPFPSRSTQVCTSTCRFGLDILRALLRRNRTTSRASARARSDCDFHTRIEGGNSSAGHQFKKRTHLPISDDRRTRSGAVIPPCRVGRASTEFSHSLVGRLHGKHKNHSTCSAW